MENERRVLQPKDSIKPQEFTQANWEYLITLIHTGEVFKNYLFRDKTTPPLPNINTSTKNWKQQMLVDLYKVDKRFDQVRQPKIPQAYFNAKVQSLKNAAKEIKKNNRYESLPQLLATTVEYPNRARQLMVSNIRTVYLLLCEPNKFLVGVGEELRWKDVNWPNEGIDHQEFYDRTTGLASVYLPLLETDIDPELIPNNPINSHDNSLQNLNVPKPARSIEELLEDAYYHQRYIVPPEGAEVRFRNAGDIDRMILKQGQDNITARFITSKGDETVSLSLDGAEHVPMRIMSGEEALKNVHGNLENIVAEAYHDIVTAKELPKNRFKRLGDTSINEVSEDENTPQVIYIPRVLRLGQETEVRLPFDATTREIAPHRVSGHIRKGNMTEKHRLALVEFEEQNGISILDHIPDGYTFVRPFTVPVGSDMRLTELPIFIKRRIETQLQQEIKKGINSNS